MSIINNVLKELESRPSQFTSIDVVSTSAREQAGGNSKSTWFVILPAVTVCVIGLFYYLAFYPSNNTPEVYAQANATVTEEDVASSVPTIDVIEPNRITGLQIRETASQFSLEFQLRENAVSYLRERSENRFIYHLKGVVSEIEVPRINNNRWIERLDITPRQQGIDVVLQTSPGVLVNTARLTNSEGNIWTIRLEKLPDPITVSRSEPKVESRQQPAIGADKKPLEKVEALPVTAEADSVSEPVRVKISATDQSFNATAQLNQAAQLIRARQWPAAEKRLLDLLAGPHDLAARKQLLGLYSRSGDSENYLLTAQQSHRRYPRSDLFKTEFARALFQQKRYDEAIELLQTSAKPDSVQHALMAASYQRKDRHQKAIEHYHHALKLDKAQARNWIGLGVSLEHEARPEKALQSYQTALRLGNLGDRLTRFVENRSRMLRQGMN